MSRKWFFKKVPHVHFDELQFFVKLTFDYLVFDYLAFDELVFVDKT